MLLDLVFNDDTTAERTAVVLKDFGWTPLEQHGNRITYEHEAVPFNKLFNAFVAFIPVPRSPAFHLEMQFRVPQSIEDTFRLQARLLFDCVPTLMGLAIYWLPETIICDAYQLDQRGSPIIKPPVIYLRH